MAIVVESQKKKKYKKPESRGQEYERGEERDGISRRHMVMMEPGFFVKTLPARVGCLIFHLLILFFSSYFSPSHLSLGQPPRSAVQTVAEKLEDWSWGSILQNSSHKISQKFLLFSQGSSFPPPLKPPGNLEQLLNPKRRGRKRRKGQTCDGNIGGLWQVQQATSKSGDVGSLQRVKLVEQMKM